LRSANNTNPSAIKLHFRKKIKLVCGLKSSTLKDNARVSTKASVLHVDGTVSRNDQDSDFDRAYIAEVRLADGTVAATMDAQMIGSDARQVFAVVRNARGPQLISAAAETLQVNWSVPDESIRDSRETSVASSGEIVVASTRGEVSFHNPRTGESLGMLSRNGAQIGLCGDGLAIASQVDRAGRSEGWFELRRLSRPNNESN
jgi:hypothetical protein